MLHGIDQLEILDDCWDLVKQGLAQGVNPLTVTNFKDKEILDCLHELKVEYDQDYFRRQTYREFLADPLGAKLIDAWAATDPEVKDNVQAQNIIMKKIEDIARTAQLHVDLSAPSQKRQKWLDEEELRR